MSLHRRSIGIRGEQHAAIFLHQKGYRIVQMNYYTHWGEIDIIAEKDDVLVFVEVKTKVGDLKGKPYEAVHYHKLSNLKRPIQLFLMEHKLLKKKHRLDVISILLDEHHIAKEIVQYENIEIKI